MGSSAAKIPELPRQQSAFARNEGSFEQLFSRYDGQFWPPHYRHTSSLDVVEIRMISGAGHDYRQNRNLRFLAGQSGTASALGIVG